MINRLDTIGVASSVGINRIIRHAIWDHILGLTSDNNYNGQTNTTNLTDIIIHPDYYTTTIFKQLLGYGILQISNNLSKGRTLRTYGFCSKTNEVLLMIINVQNEYANLNVTFSDHQLSPSNIRYEYHFLPYNGSNILNSNYVTLNGKIMPDHYTSYPNYNPLTMPNAQPITIAPYGITYVIFKNVNIEACSN